MEPKKPPINPLCFEDPRQERNYQKLRRLVGPGPAAFYRDACLLMAEVSPFASTTHLVAHFRREIESALRDVLEPVVDRAERLKRKGDPTEEKHKAEILQVIPTPTGPISLSGAKALTATFFAVFTAQKDNPERFRDRF